MLRTRTKKKRGRIGKDWQPTETEESQTSFSRHNVMNSDRKKSKLDAEEMEQMEAVNNLHCGNVLLSRTVL
jgi:hypothetical protein